MADKYPSIAPLRQSPEDFSHTGIQDFQEGTEDTGRHLLRWLAFSESPDQANGFKATGDDDSFFQVIANSPADMKVRINPGIGVISFFPIGNWEVLETGTFIPPSADPRIDLICWSAVTNGINIVTGTEAGSPAAPSTPASNIVAAHIFHRVGETQIDLTDLAAGDGYIIDKRALSLL